MSCWIKCLCRVYECLGAMLPAVWGGIGVCVRLGARRPAPALMVSDQSRLKHKTWVSCSTSSTADAALHRAVCLSALWL